MGGVPLPAEYRGGWIRLEQSKACGQCTRVPVNAFLDGEGLIEGFDGLKVVLSHRACDGAETIVIDGVAERLDRTVGFGADHTIDLTVYETVEARCNRVEELTGGLGADVAVEVTGVSAAVEEGLHLHRKGGRYLVTGNIIPGKKASIDPGQVVRKSIETVTTMRYAPTRLNDALSFLSTYGDDYPFDDLIDASYTLSDVGRALRDSANREVTRATLIPE